jgi:uroporphyrinogen-III synthase
VIGDARDAIARLGADDWLVLTSAFAAACVAAQPARSPRVAAVGPATAEAARAHGFRVELVGRDDAAALLDQLRAMPVGGRICHPRSALAQPIAGWGSVVIESPVVYETRMLNFDRSIIQRVDIAAITSPSALRAIGRIELPLASLGPATTSAIETVGMTPRVVASEPTFESLAAAIAIYARSSQRHRA